MINALGSAGLLQSIDALRADRVKASAPAPKISASVSEGKAPATAAAALAAEGAPIDGAKVAALKAAIASRTYAIDAQAIADAMIGTDLPGGK